MLVSAPHLAWTGAPARMQSSGTQEGHLHDTVSLAFGVLWFRPRACYAKRLLSGGVLMVADCIGEASLEWVSMNGTHPALCYTPMREEIDSIRISDRYRPRPNERSRLKALAHRMTRRSHKSCQLRGRAFSRSIGYQTRPSNCYRDAKSTSFLGVSFSDSRESRAGGRKWPQRA